MVFTALKSPSDAAGNPASITLTPNFSTFRLSFLEQGGIYVMSNLRGGGEYGDEWHEAGTVPKGSKQNVFDDFIA